MTFKIHNANCLDVLRQMPDNSVDSIVTDPPYGLNFMGKKWDYDVPSVEIWAECLRVLKPGGHLLAFAGTRTQHRMAVRIEDAGFEIRDMIAWVYGSGFPKSLDVSKAIDKAAGAERTDVVGKSARCIGPSQAGDNGIGTFKETNWAESNLIYAPATEAARQWQGWGTALKPSLEPITVARKPLAGTVAANILAHGTGAINVDGCRVDFRGDADKAAAKPGGKATAASGNLAGKAEGGAERTEFEAVQGSGRWPANLIHDGSDEVAALFPAKAGAASPVKGTEASRASDGGITGERQRVAGAFHDDTGSAARFFYCAKASKKDRGAGNNHPTVKPTDLMRYLCRLVTPPGGTVLDPFTGSGSTGKAAVLEGFRFIGCEMSAEYAAIAEARVAAALDEYICSL